VFGEEEKKYNEFPINSIGLFVGCLKHAAERIALSEVIRERRN